MAFIIKFVNEKYTELYTNINKNIVFTIKKYRLK